MVQTSSQSTVNKIEMRLRGKGTWFDSLSTRLCRLRNTISREVNIPSDVH